MFNIQGQQVRRLRHFHFLEWPDNGVPDQQSLVSYVETVRDQIPQRGGPIVVHCRSEDTVTVGTLCTTDGGLVVKLIVIFFKTQDKVPGCLKSYKENLTGMTNSPAAPQHNSSLSVSKTVLYRCTTTETR